jgi:hypothetical protein
MVFSDFFEGCGPIVDRYYFVTSIREDLSPHILGGHTIVREQYFPRQRMSFESGGDMPKLP